MTAVDDAPAATGVPASQEVALEQATQWGNEYMARLTERAQSYLATQNGQSNGGLAPHIGAPTTGNPITGFYVAFDVAATSPLQFGGPPPYHPQKIVAAGQPAFIHALIFTNPTVNVPLGWAVPASVQLGGRPWRLTLDQMNLTTGGVLPKIVKTGVFPSPAPMLHLETFALATPNPGPDPWLIEANITLDIAAPAQPYAAFVTNFLDVDNDPGFPPFPFPPIVPPVPAGLRHELPNRYLIFKP